MSHYSYVYYVALYVGYSDYIFYPQSKNGLLKREGGCFAIKLSVPEIKILILLGYFIVFGIVSLVNLTITLNEADPFLDDLLNYFACQLGGYNPECEEFRRQFEKHLKPGLNGASYLLLGLNTWVHILIATKAQDYRWLMQKIASLYHLIAKIPLQITASSSSSTKASSKSSPSA